MFYTKFVRECFILFLIKVSTQTSSVSCWFTSTLQFLQTSIKNLQHFPVLKFANRSRVPEGKAKKPEIRDTPFVILMEIYTCLRTIKEAQKACCLLVANVISNIASQQVQTGGSALSLPGGHRSIGVYGISEPTNPVRKIPPKARDAGRTHSGYRCFSHCRASKHSNEENDTTWGTSVELGEGRTSSLSPPPSAMASARLKTKLETMTLKMFLSVDFSCSEYSLLEAGAFSRTARHSAG